MRILSLTSHRALAVGSTPGKRDLDSFFARKTPPRNPGFGWGRGPGLAVLVVLFALSMSGCAIPWVGNAQNLEPIPPARPQAIHSTLEDQGTRYGVAQPDWVKAAVSDSADQHAFAAQSEDSLLFLAMAEANNLESARLLATRMELPRTVSYAIRRRALSSMERIERSPGETKTFVGLEGRMLAILGDFSYMGVRADEEWWMHIRTAGFLGLPSPPVYRVYIRASLALSLLRQQLEICLDTFESGVTAADNESGFPARIREAILGEFGAL